MTTLRYLVLHGPNLNLLGTREPNLYGATDLQTLDKALVELGNDLGVQVECRQSNHEGVLIDWLHEASQQFSGIVFNPGGFTHTSVAIRDALAAIEAPCVEVHITHIQARESIRHHSVTAASCLGSISGFGINSYTLGLRALIEYARVQT